MPDRPGQERPVDGGPATGTPTDPVFGKLQVRAFNSTGYATSPSTRQGVHADIPSAQPVNPAIPSPAVRLAATMPSKAASSPDGKTSGPGRPD